MAVALGILSVWFGLVAAITAAVCYWVSMIRAPKGPDAQVAVQQMAASANGEDGANGRKNGKKSRGRQRGEAKRAQVERDGWLLWGRYSLFATMFCVALASVVFWSLIMSETYSVQYIWKNSNPDLTSGYRFATFWADQEGTFLLWALLTTILGVIFFWKSRDDERWVMPFYSLIFVFLFSMMNVISPFGLHSLAPDENGYNQIVDAMVVSGIPIPQTYFERLIYMLGLAPVYAIPPESARGLNELLQNPWMRIHPPTLFLGYSSMALPGCMALGALAKRDYDSWVNRAAPWLMWAWFVLGVGVFLGAYWAYETLGWGGYWSWDPVENSSFMPWLIGTALIHGLLSQRVRGNYKHINLLLGSLLFVAVLYGSFLTRSGVLSDVSVHSFATPGAAVYTTLSIVLIAWTVMAVGLWVFRFRDIRATIAYDSVWERPFGIFIGLFVLCFSALVVCAGVSWPLVTPLLLQTKMSAEYYTYNRLMAPLVFGMCLLIALTPLFSWRRVRKDRALKLLVKCSLVIAGMLVLAFIPTGIWAARGGFESQNGPALFVIFLAAVFAVGTSLIMLKRSLKAGLLATGPWLAHIGFTVMLIGVLQTSFFNKTLTFTDIPSGQTVSAIGYNMEFLGIPVPVRLGRLLGVSAIGYDVEFLGPRDPDPNDRDDRQRMRFKVTRGNFVRVVEPKLFTSKLTGDTVAWPQIIHRWTDLKTFGDLYFEPTGYSPGGVPLGLLKPGETSAPVMIGSAEAGTASEVTVSVSDWRQISDEDSDQPLEMGVLLSAEIDGERVTGLMPTFTLEKQAQAVQPQRPATISTKDGDYYLVVSDASLTPAEAGPVVAFQLIMIPVDSKGTVSFQVLHIPGIQVLWFGCYLLFLGAFISYRRRAQLANRPVVSGVGPAAKSEPKPEPEPAPEPEEAAVPVGAE